MKSHSFIKSVIAIAIALFLLQCKSTSEPDNDQIVADIPLGLTAVYATAVYSDVDTALQLRFYTITALRYEEITANNDTTHFRGTVEQFFSIPKNSYTVSGPTEISITDKWVFLQNHPQNINVGVFLKQDSIIVDTTEIPTPSHNQFPMYPRVMEGNQHYIVVRPADDGFGFLEVRREFNTKSLRSWQDDFASDIGLFTKIRQTFLGDDLNFLTIFDEHGIVNSQFSFTEVLTDPTGTAIDTVETYTINRRIRDFSSPSSILPLEIYGEQVEKSGLLLFADE